MGADDVETLLFQMVQVLPSFPLTGMAQREDHLRLFLVNIKIPLGPHLLSLYLLQLSNYKGKYKLFIQLISHPLIYFMQRF